MQYIDCYNLIIIMVIEYLQLSAINYVCLYNRIETE